MRHALLLLLLVSGPLHAACDAPEHRQFDFWIGTWDVQGAAGKPASRNVIERAFGGCALVERYTAPGGYQGQSLNAWDAGRRRWHQTWVDNGGLLLQLDGGWSGTQMVLEGEVVRADGTSQANRIRWTPNPDGTVRQHWETRGADGEWTTTFDGLYRRVADAAGTAGGD